MEKQQGNGGRPDGHQIPIQIDHKPYKAEKTPLTGAELRTLANPDIGSDRDLFRVVQGHGDDVKVGDQETVSLEPGMHFYSAPKTINPGGQDCAVA
jgi:hypothetical protein